MYKVTFNSVNVATFDKENDAINLSLNLHKISNISHNIVVTKDDEEIIIFKQF